MLKSCNNSSAKQIRGYLDDFNYNLVYREISSFENYYYNPYQKKEVLCDNLSRFDLQTRTLFDLVLLGEKLDYAFLCDTLDKRFISRLIEVGFLRQEGYDVFSDGYSIISYLDFYFVVAIPNDYNNCGDKQDIYIGTDSYRLTSILPHREEFGSFLDLCTGSGIQGILESCHAKSGYLVEKNPKVIEATKFNVVLNGLENKVKAVFGDLYGAVPARETFDVITSNPPFIPVPEDIEYPLAGGGGKDGLEIVNKIMQGYNTYLKAGGVGIICGEAIGNKDFPLLVPGIKKILSTGYKVTLMLHAKIDTNTLANNMVEICGNVPDIDLRLTYYETWMKLYRELDCSHYYVFTLIAKKTDSEVQTEMKIIHPKEKLSFNRVFSLSQKFEITGKDELYQISFENGETLSADGFALKILQLLDGSHDLYWVFNQLFIGMPLSEEQINYFKNKVIDFCNNLMNKNVLQLKAGAD